MPRLRLSSLCLLAALVGCLAEAGSGASSDAYDKGNVVSDQWGHNATERSPSVQFVHRGIIPSFVEANEAWLRVATEANREEPKAYWSLRHQQDLLRFIAEAPVEKRATEAGIDLDIYRLGTLDSDKGKLGGYVSLLTTDLPSTTGVAKKSDFLIRVMQLRTVEVDGISTAVPVEATGNILAEYFGTRIPVLNPALDPGQVRALLRENPILLGWLHDWPGAADSMEIAARGHLTVTELENILRTNLFHNGPEAGFWEDFTNLYVPGALRSSEEKRAQAHMLFSDTVFSPLATADGTPYYPMPRSVEGILHVAIDRLSQATRGGFTKIWHELGSPPAAFIESVIVDGTSGTIAQLEALRRHTEGGDFLTGPQRSFLLQVIDLSIERIGAAATYPRHELEKAGEAEFTRALSDWTAAEERHNGEAIRSVATGL